ncbi:RNA polymerase sigma factor [Nocardioides pocheonensis]|uniref:RNA polymerase sigma factor n=1 Tax=Nocardioides pocheonensis TaxID=661485 RepID=A0A3N0GV49_9ACTN|nr:RNA polymerase sigma factor [Nocardioides pocheonensis]RNM16327.1 RNA polymerase sigma factor [Nocardioides pocheonensis]
MRDAVDLHELFDAAYARLVVQLYAICGDMADAEDAVQDAFVTAIRKQRQLQHVSNPEAWVRTVAVSRVRGGWRHAAVVRRYQPRVPGPQTPVEVGPEHVAIVTALSDLDVDQRIVVVLHHLVDLGTAEIAAELGIPEGTVKSRLARARARLAALLEEEPRHA